MTLCKFQCRFIFSEMRAWHLQYLSMLLMFNAIQSKFSLRLNAWKVYGEHLVQTIEQVNLSIYVDFFHI